MAGRQTAAQIDADPELGVGLRAQEDDDVDDERQPLLSKDEPSENSITPTSDILSFSTPMYYTQEFEATLEIEVIRLGSMRGTASAKYSTEDVSAKTGQHFKACSGQVTFLPGEERKIIELEIIEDGLWTPSLEFKVYLYEPKNCKLSNTVATSRVKILNEDVFPSNKYSERVQTEELVSQIGPWSLFVSLLMHLFRKPRIRDRTILCLIFDQLHNICLFVSMCVYIYMVDVLFERGASTRTYLLIKGDRYRTSLLIASWYVVPAFFLFAWDRCKVHLNIKGRCQRHLQVSMMRQYLQYTDESRRHVTPTDLTLAATSNGEVVSDAYMAAISIFQTAGKMLALVLFICLFQWDHLAIFTLVSMPAIMMAIILLRLGTFQQVHRLCDERFRVMVMLTNETAQKLKLVSEFYKRHVMGDIFHRASTDNIQAKMPETSMLLEMLYSTRFISGFFIALYIVVKTPAVLDDQNPLSLGLFLSTITIYGTYLADAITQFNADIQSIYMSFTALQDFTFFLNLPLDLPARKKVTDIRRWTTSKLRDSAAKLKHNVDVVDADTIPLRAVNVELENFGRTVLEDVNVSVKQGTLVAVTGPPASGKKAFMELMADVTMPTHGFIYMPAHLKVRYISREPMFLHMSLIHNLTLGLADHHRVDYARITKILEILEMPDVIAICAKELEAQKSLDAQKSARPSREKKTRMGERLASSGERLKSANHLVDVGDDTHEVMDMAHKVTSWLEGLSTSERIKLQFARAFIANPNVMVFQRPFMYFQGDAAMKIVHLFRKHIRERGLGYNEDSFNERRPRTVMFCTETEAQAHEADAIIEVNKKTCSVVKEHTRSEEQEGILHHSVSSVLDERSLTLRDNHTLSRSKSGLARDPSRKISTSSSSVWRTLA